jgi:hypothetical protein
MMMDASLNQAEWVKLSPSTRIKLAEIFEIPKTTGSQVEVVAGQTIVVSDGHTHNDLKVLTVQKMKDYLAKIEYVGPLYDDFFQLFDIVVSKIENKELEPKKAEVQFPDTDAEAIKKDWQEVINEMKRQSIQFGLEVELRRIFGKSSQKKSFPNI